MQTWAPSLIDCMDQNLIERSPQRLHREGFGSVFADLGGILQGLEGVLVSEAILGATWSMWTHLSTILGNLGSTISFDVI